MEQCEDYWIYAPDQGCDGPHGWQVFDDDDGAPCALLAEFDTYDEAITFCAMRRAIVA